MILDDIVEKKIEYLKKHDSKKLITDKATKSFYSAIAKDGLSIIGEIKKASPSKGIIKADFNPVEIAKKYCNVVDAISVLTEEDFFLGKPEYLKQVHDTVDTPILRKDFIIDSSQIFEAKDIGASAILLIVAILDIQKLKQFLKLAHELNLDSLVEVHNESEIQLALEAGADIIGINNRDLKTFNVDLNNTLNLRKFIPENILVVSESGINTQEDIKFLKHSNIDAVLVGESFMRTDNILNKANEFRDAFK